MVSPLSLSGWWWWSHSLSLSLSISLSGCVVFEGWFLRWSLTLWGDVLVPFVSLCLGVASLSLSRDVVCASLSLGGASQSLSLGLALSPSGASLFASSLLGLSLSPSPSLCAGISLWIPL